MPAGTDVVVHPLTPERWPDLLALFGPSGAYSGCWCMWWRVSSAEFDRESGAGLRRRFEALVKGGAVPGLLGYVDDEPAGWVSLGPRDDFGRLNRSPKLRAVDDTPVWSIVCFFITRAHRKRGVAASLLDAAVRYAAEHGAGHVEGYPIDPVQRPGAAAAFTGVCSMFENAGFEEIARRGGRPIVRRPAP